MQGSSEGRVALSLTDPSPPGGSGADCLNLNLGSPLPRWPGANILTSLCLGSLICNLGVLTVPALLGCFAQCRAHSECAIVSRFHDFYIQSTTPRWPLDSKTDARCRLPETPGPDCPPPVSETGLGRFPWGCRQEPWKGGQSGLQGWTRRFLSVRAELALLLTASSLLPPRLVDLFQVVLPQRVRVMLGLDPRPP